MTDNETISQWRGECRHPQDFLWDGMHGGYVCHVCDTSMDKAEFPSDYSNDPAAWGPELFEAIERAGLKKPFIGWLGEHADLHNAKTFEDFRDTIDEYVWLIAKSTPEQKARALARAIKEVKG